MFIRVSIIQIATTPPYKDANNALGVEMWSRVGLTDYGLIIILGSTLLGHCEKAKVMQGFNGVQWEKRETTQIGQNRTREWMFG